MKDLPFQTNKVWPRLKEDHTIQMIVGIFVLERVKEIKDREQHLNLMASRVDNLVQEAKEME